MKPVIAVDTRMLRHSGIGTYLRHLIQGLARRACGNSSEQYRFYGRPEMLAKVISDVAPSSFIRFVSPIYSLREHWDFALLPNRWDVWHSPHYNVPCLKKGKLVVTVHDLTHVALGKKFFNPVQRLYAKTSFSWVRKHADAVIAVSQHTKKDLVEWVGVDPKKIAVIYEAASEHFRPSEDSVLQATRKKYDLQGPFLLYVGNIKPHKNVARLLKVFRSLRSQKKIQELLVLVGRVDEKYAAQEKDIQAARQDPAVRFLSEVSLEDLPGLYGLARAMILPSLYEGFGLVVLEAMACGTPVILSNRTSLPEIAGNAAEIFDPEDETAMAHAIEKVLGQETLRNNLRNLGIERTKQFSWSKMVEETVKLYEEVVAHTRKF